MKLTIIFISLSAQLINKYFFNCFKIIFQYKKKNKSGIN